MTGIVPLCHAFLVNNRFPETVRSVHEVGRELLEGICLCNIFAQCPAFTCYGFPAGWLKQPVPRVEIYFCGALT